MLKDSVLFPPTGRKKDNKAEIRKGSTALKHPAHTDIPFSCNKDLCSLNSYCNGPKSQKSPDHNTRLTGLKNTEFLIKSTTVQFISYLSSLEEERALKNVHSITFINFLLIFLSSKDIPDPCYLFSSFMRPS